LKKPEPVIVEPVAKPDIVKQRHAKLLRRCAKWSRELERAKRLYLKGRARIGRVPAPPQGTTGGIKRLFDPGCKLGVFFSPVIQPTNVAYHAGQEKP
jgi:hypothetical protein